MDIGEAFLSGRVNKLKITCGDSSAKAPGSYISSTAIQAAETFCAAATGGGVPTFRKIAVGDLPDLKSIYLPQPPTFPVSIELPQVLLCNADGTLVWSDAFQEINELIRSGLNGLRNEKFLNI